MAPINNIFPSFLTKKGPTVRAMQEVLQRIGEATAGSKNTIQTRLLTKVMYDKIPRLTSEPQKRNPRILSIDMGIKNLAYCVADVEKPTLNDSTVKMDIRAWRVLDLSEAFRDSSLGGDQKSIAKIAALEDQKDEDFYTPEKLSRMAYWFLRKILLGWSPDIILIERQRWRSSGSPTVQQWTVRVNTLEAAMWAVMTTLKSERNNLSDCRIYAVDPKRVGHFWLDYVTPVPTPSRARKEKVTKSTTESEKDEGDVKHLEGEDTGGTIKLARGKAEKKAKIQLLRTWLDSDNPSTTLSVSSKTIGSGNFHPRISFSFCHKEPTASLTSFGADATRQALLYATDKPSERPKRTVYQKVLVKKVDDITDCFLQAAAWVAWEENLSNLRPQVNEFQEEVEDKLGRKLIVMPGHLADAVEELQSSGKRDAEQAAESDEKVVKKTPKSKK